MGGLHQGHPLHQASCVLVYVSGVTGLGCTVTCNYINQKDIVRRNGGPDVHVHTTGRYNLYELGHAPHATHFRPGSHTANRPTSAILSYDM